LIAVDTNLLIYAHRAALPEHRPARRALEDASQDPHGWGIPLPCISEFWSVVTHPAAAGGPSTPQQARAFLAGLVQHGGAAVWAPRDGFWERLTQLSADLRIQGPRIFDLQIALTAFDNGASEMWTHDRHFTTLPGLRRHHPF